MLEYFGTIITLIPFGATFGFICFFVGRFAWELADRIIEEWEAIRLNRRLKENGIGK
jgi:hypothetical protein